MSDCPIVECVDGWINVEGDEFEPCPVCQPEEYPET